MYSHRDRIIFPTLQKETNSQQHKITKLAYNVHITPTNRNLLPIVSQLTLKFQIEHLLLICVFVVRIKAQRVKQSGHFKFNPLEL